MSLAGAWLDEIDVEPLHELLADRSIIETTLWKVQDDKEREAPVDGFIMFSDSVGMTAL
jgi:hypothetical protein